MFKDIVYTIEFNDDIAVDRANELLEKNWVLLHVGTKLVDILDNGQAYYATAYVVGANQQQFEDYKEDQEQLEEELGLL